MDGEFDQTKAGSVNYETSLLRSPVGLFKSDLINEVTLLAELIFLYFTVRGTNMWQS